MDEDSDGEDFDLEVPPLAVYIKGIIERYPAGQIFKELIQNADDAGASKVHFFLDTRTHSQHSLVNPALAQFQGPALLAYNDAQFTPKDWENILKPQQSYKQDDPLKVGKFGIGFNSVYHITDLPTIISGSKVGFIEPFGEIWPGKFGRLFSISNSKVKTMLAPFNGMCGFSNEAKIYDHTLFFFFLSPTNLSESCYNIKKLHELIEALKEEAQYLLLFLHSVSEVQVFEISSSGKQVGLFKVKIREHETISSQRKKFRGKVRSARDQQAVSHVENFHVDTIRDKTESKHWLVVSIGGSERQCDWSKADEQKILPWVGCALELRENWETDLTSSDSDLVKTNSDGGTSSLGEGRIFCFLPMPKETCSPLPVHVNGTFGLNDDRRTLKWPSGERRHDLTAEWNMTIIGHLLPPCYAQLILEAIKLGVSHTQVYNAWPQIQNLRDTNWNGLLKPLFTNLLQEGVFWYQDPSLKPSESWVSLNNATFVPRREELSSVVEKVLSSCGLRLVKIPDHVWDAMYDKEVNKVSPTLLRHTLRSHSDVYNCLPVKDKYKVLHYSLSDEVYEDLGGLQLLPLANGTFCEFENGTSEEEYYVCSDQHPRALLPRLEGHLVDLSSINKDQHRNLLKVASSGKTQLRELDARGVSKLLSLSMPERWRDQKVVPTSELHFPQQWFEIFWKWAQIHDLQLFTDQMVLPIVKSLTQKQHNSWATSLVCKSKVVFISHSDDLACELLGGLEKIGLLFTGDSNNLFPYLQPVHSKLLSNCFVNSPTPDGVLRAIAHSHAGDLQSLQDIEFTDIQAQELQRFINSGSITEHEQVILLLPIFKVLNRKKLFSLESASRDSWNQRAVLECAGGFDISSNLLPPNLVVFSSAHNETDLIRFYTSKVSTPDKADFIQDTLIPIISSNAYPDCSLNELMVEILQQLLTMKNTSSRLDLCKKLFDLPFLQYSSTNYRKAPNQLFDISKEELKDLFIDEPVFPKPPFIQPDILTALRECHLRQSVEAKEIVEVILSISREPMRPTTLSRAKAVLRYLDMHPELLHEQVEYEGDLYSFNSVLPSISKNACWLPVEVNPPDGYPDCLEWKGSCCSSSLTMLSSSVLICCEDHAVALSHILGSKMYIVICGFNLSQVFKSHIPLEQIGQHYKQVVENCQNISKEKLNDIVCETYRQFSNNPRQDLKLKDFFPTSWLWIREHGVFIESQNAALHPHPSLHQNLDPYLFIVPENLRKFSNLFKKLGIVEHFMKSQGLRVLATVKHEMEQLQTRSGETWTVVIAILNWLTADGLQSLTLDPGETLFVPIESESDTLRLEDSNTVCFADDQCLKAFLSTIDEKYTLCHDRISHLAPRLGITPLSKRLDISDDIFDDVGQHEPLEVRIRGILRDYKDGVTIIKELLQNADDAGATEVNLCFDTRHHKTKPHIFPDMAKCYGPALIVHNNKVFTDEDFESITKLAGATKQNKPLKIGKFGVGFCSVYHITDVPSFVSREYFCVFDPTLQCLRGHVRDTSRPGKKVKFTGECIKRSGLLAPYQGLYGFDPQKPFEGTIFRFPFRDKCSDISDVIYTERHIDKLIRDIQKSASKLLLFLQNVQHIIFSEFKEDDTFQVLLDIQKHASESLVTGTQLLKIEYDVKQTRPSSHYKEVWLVSSLTEGIKFLSQERDGTTSVACKLQSSTSSDLQQNTIEQISGEVFCFLPLSLQSGLPVHVSANFAVLNDRTGIRSSDEYDIGANEAKWNVSLIQMLLPKAYLNLLLCLSQLHIKGDLKYSFYSLWPLKGKLTNHNPWDALIQPLYLLIAGEKLLYSKYTREWLTIDEGNFLPSDILCLAPSSSTPDCVYGVVKVLSIPIIDLTSEYMAHFPEHRKEACIIKENEFVNRFFNNINDIDVATRNATLLVLLKCFSVYPKRQYLRTALQENCCIPCSPDGQQVKKCHEIIDIKAPFSPLYTPEEGMFPEELFHCSSTRPAMTSLGMITDYLPWNMLTERAGTISKLRNKLEALQRAKLVLKCISDNLSLTNSQSQRHLMSSHSSPERSQHASKDCSQLQSIKFLPIKPHLDNYPSCLTWCGVGFCLLSPKEIYIGESCANLAGSQICLLCTQEPELGGCGYVTREVISGLGIKTQPPLLAVIQHFHHIITVFISLKDSGKPQSISHEWLDDVCSGIYKFLDKDENLSGSELGTWPCIWTGSDFIQSDAVALNSTYNGPYLFKLPDCLKGKTNLLRALKIKQNFTIHDLQATLKKMKSEFKENPISERCRKVIPLLLTDIASMIAEGQSLDLDVFLPDIHFVMQRASELAYNDAPWCKPTSDILFISNAIPREVAVKLGVQPVRSKFLELYEGEEFGQSEELTQRIKNILRDYPLDITILKELLQNADDAKATKMYIILDKRTHGMDTLPSDEWRDLQGPALLIWNNSTFQGKDFKGIQKLGLGSKRSEAETIGMYGIGFNVVYHLTDCPSFISTEKNGKSTLCVLDPHCRYIPGAKKLSPGRRFNNLDKKFWTHWSDLRSAYLQTGILGLPEEMKSGSLFRFPLRHEKLFHKSELVDQDSHSILGKIKPTNAISANLMQKYLKEWCPDLKQSLFFLNNVTELKVFEINSLAALRNNSMQLVHWYEAKIDDHAKASRALLQTNVQRFKAKSTPYLERYTLTLIDKGLGGKEDVAEKWFIQQGVGDIDNPQQEWHFLPHMKPKHGIAAPLCAPSKASEMRRKSQLFCFLPLQVFSNLPVHVNGSFVLDSSRRKLWQSAIPDELTKWNERVLKAIASSYAEFLVQSQVLYIDPVNTTKKTLWNSICQYYNAFPTWLGKSIHFPPPEDRECLSLAKMVYHRLLTKNARVLVHNREKASSTEHEVEYLPLIDDNTPQNQAYFWDEKRDTNGLGLVLKKIGMQLTAAPMRILHHFSDLGGCSLHEASSKAVFKYYARFHGQVSPNNCCPQHISTTCFESVEAFKLFTKYILQSSKEEAELIFPQDPSSLPLLLTSDNQLRMFLWEDKVIRSHFSSLFSPCAGEHFLHPELLEVRYIKSYFLQPSTKNWEKIQSIFTMTLPKSLNDVMLKSASDHVNLLKSLWQCLAQDEIFKIHLQNILKIWALIPSTWDQQLSTFSLKSQILPIMPPLPLSSERDVFHIIQRIGMPIFDVSTAAYDLCHPFCPTLFKPHLVLQSLYHFHCQSYTHPFLSSCQGFSSVATALLKYFGKIHLSQKPESLKQVKSLPIFRGIGGTFCSITGTVFIWPRNVCKAGQKVWLQCSPDTVFLDENGDWTHLGNADMLGISHITVFDVYNKFIFQVFGKLTSVERLQHLQHIRDHLFKDAETYSKSQSDDRKHAAKTFISNLKKLPCLEKDGILQPLCEFCDPQQNIFREFEYFVTFPPGQMQDENWLKFLRKIGLRTAISKKEFLHFCHLVEEDKCSNSKDASTVLLQYLFNEKDWYTEVGFLGDVSDIAFVVVEQLQKLSKIKPCALGERRVQSTSLTSLCKATEYEDACLIWTVKPVVQLPSLPPTVQYSNEVRAKLLHSLKVERVTTDNVIQNLINVSHTDFSNFSNFDNYPQHLRESKHHSLIDVLLTNFKYLNDKCSKEYEGLSQLSTISCIPVCAEGKVEEINCPVLVKPLQVIAVEPKALIPYASFLNPLPQDFYSCLHHILSTIGVQQKVTVRHVRGALEDILHHTHETLDVNTMEVVRNLMQVLQQLLRTRPTTSKDELDLGLCPLYLPNTDRHLVESTSLLYEDTRYFRNENFSFEKVPYSKFSLLTEKKDIRREEQFCLAIPKAIAPKSLSTSCIQKVSGSFVEVESSRLVESLQKTFGMPTLAAAVCALLSFEGDQLSKRAQNSIRNFFHNARFVAVLKLLVEVDLKFVEPPACIGTAEVDFHAHKHCDGSYLLYVVADSCVPRIYKSMAAFILPIVVEMSDTTIDHNHQECEELLSQLLMANNAEDIIDIMSEHHISLSNTEDLNQLTPFDPNIEPNLGSPIPESWHHRLQQDIDNLFRAGEWVGYEKADDIIVFARIGYKVEKEHNELESFDQYLIHVEEQDPNGIVVSVVSIYKILRTLRKQPNSSNEGTLVVYDENSDAAKLRRKFDTEELKRAKKEICEELRRIWKLPEELRRRAIKRMYLKWHPDKHDNKALAEKAFQFLLHQISLLEEGQSLEDPEEEKSASSPMQRRTAWNPWYHTWDGIARRHRESRKQDQNEKSFNLQEPPTEPHNAQIWIKQAECDFEALTILKNAVKYTQRVCANVCFLAHEVAEKSLKAGMFAVCGLHSSDLKYHHLITNYACSLHHEKPSFTEGLTGHVAAVSNFYNRTRWPNQYTPHQVPADHYYPSQASEAEEHAKAIFQMMKSLVDYMTPR